jgi:hypothetical protein
MPGMMRVPRSTAALVTVVVATLSVAACGADQPAVCGSVDALSSSVEHLGELQLGENGRDQLESQLAQVRADLSQVKSDAGQQYGSQVAKVTAAVGAVRTQFQAAKADPSAATIKPLGAAITDLGSEIRALTDAVTGTC